MLPLIRRPGQALLVSKRGSVGPCRAISSPYAIDLMLPGTAAMMPAANERAPSCASAGLGVSYVTVEQAKLGRRAPCSRRTAGRQVRRRRNM